MKIKLYYIVEYGDDGADLTSFVWATSKKKAWKLWRKEYQREPEAGATLYRVKHVHVCDPHSDVSASLLDRVRVIPQHKIVGFRPC